MKRWIYKHLLTFIIIGLINVYVNAQETYIKNIEKIFPIELNGGEVEINNRYGKVHIRTWDKDSVKIMINYTITAKNQEKLEKTKNAVKFDFVTGDEYVIATTNIYGEAVFKQDIERIANAFSSSNPANAIIINYKVFIPKEVELKIDNKYGDVFIDRRHTKTKIHVAHGDLRALELGGLTFLDLEFCEANIREIKKGSLNAQYSNLDIEELENVSITSKSSTFRINKGHRIKINSKRDTYHIRSMEAITGNCYLSKINLRNLLQEVHINAKYGHVFIDNISPKFQNINIDSKYTDFNFNFEEGSSYNFELNYKKFDVSYPDHIASIKTTINEEDDNYKHKIGKIGKSNSPTSKVKINAENGELFISHF